MTEVCKICWVTILKVTDNLDDALRAEKKYLRGGTVSSDATSDFETPPKRIRNHITRLSPNEVVDAANVTPAGGSMQFPAPPAPVLQQDFRRNAEYQPMLPELFSDIEHNAIQTETLTELTPIRQCQDASTSQTPYHTAEVYYPTPVRVSQTQNCTGAQESLILQALARMSEEILQLKTFNNNMMNVIYGMDQRLRSLQADVIAMRNNKTNNGEEQLFPIATLEALDFVEETLKNRDKFRAVVNKLIPLAGPNLKESVRNMMGFVLSLQITSLVNWRGVHSKRGMSNTLIMRAVMDGIVADENHPNEKLEDVRAALSRWLLTAYERVSKREKKVLKELSANTCS